MNESYVRARITLNTVPLTVCHLPNNCPDCLSVCLSVCTSEQLKRIRYCVRGELYWPNSVGLLAAAAATGSGNSSTETLFPLDLDLSMCEAESAV